MPPLSERTRHTLRASLAPHAEVANPIDLTPTATAAHYRRALEAALADDGVDAAVVLFMPPLADKPDEVAAAILDAAATAPDKPVVTSFLGGAGVADLLHRDELVVPTYTFPEAAAASLGHAAAYQAWRRTPRASSPTSRESTRRAPGRWSPPVPPARFRQRSPPSCWRRTESPYATPRRARGRTRSSPSARTRSSGRWSPSGSPGTTPTSWRTSHTASPRSATATPGR